MSTRRQIIEWHRRTGIVIVSIRNNSEVFISEKMKGEAS